MSEPDAEVQFVELPFPFVESDEAKLRCFIAENYMNAEIDGTILIDNMQHIFEWIKEGKLVPKARAKPQLVKP